MEKAVFDSLTPVLFTQGTLRPYLCMANNCLKILPGSRYLSLCYEKVLSNSHEEQQVLCLKVILILKGLFLTYASYQCFHPTV